MRYQVDGRGRVVWHGWRLLAGMRSTTVEVLADHGRRVAVLPKAFGEGSAMAEAPLVRARRHRQTEGVRGGVDDPIGLPSRSWRAGARFAARAGLPGPEGGAGAHG